MDYPYQLDDFSAVYCQKKLEPNKKRVLDTSIEKLTIELDINIQKSTIPTLNKPLISTSKRSKYNSICKRCQIYSFNTCDCVIRSLENVHIDGKQRKITL